MEPIRVVELFAGIGAQHQALKQAQIPHEVVAISEIDQGAVRAYEAIHGPTNNLGDITKVEHLPDCDLLTYSFPCQDLSVAGKRKGMSKGSGTRSGLLWEVERLLADMRERESLPNALLMENVDAILFEANIRDFKKWIARLSEFGYTSSYKVLDAADYGVPQRRKRCFMVSLLDGRFFTFPKGIPLDKRLKDVLEDDVDESYYLTDEQIASYVAHDQKQRERERIHDPSGEARRYVPYIDYQPLQERAFPHPLGRDRELGIRQGQARLFRRRHSADTDYQGGGGDVRIVEVHT